METNRRTVSVVIANYNGLNSLGPTLESVLGQDVPGLKEVLVVDNQSTDGSVEFARKTFSRIRVLQTGDNRGPNVARNRGIREASTDYVLVMDNDIILSPGFLGRIMGAMETVPGAGAMGCQIRLHAQPDVVQYNGNNVNYVGAGVHNRVMSEAPARVNILAAGAVLLDRQAVLDVGGFDEDFVFGWEDGDLTFRLNILGHPTYVLTTAVAYHMKGDRGLKWARSQIRNRWWFMLKNYDTRTLVLCAIPILCYQASAVLYCLAHGRFRDVAGAYGDIIRSWPEVMRKRREILRRKTVGDSRVLCGRAIDVLNDQGTSFLFKVMNGMANALIGGYWVVIRVFLK